MTRPGGASGVGNKEGIRKPSLIFSTDKSVTLTLLPCCAPRPPNTDRLLKLVTNALDDDEFSYAY